MPLHLGSAWYPEHWPEQRWAADVKLMRDAGLTVAFNDPYKGGFITTHHGRPQDGIHAIQIEMRRDLYMDETRYERLRGKLENLRAVLAGLLRKLDDLKL